MLYVMEGNVIRLTRGDTARLTIDIRTSSTSSIYEMSEGDILSMTIKKSVKVTDVSLHKESIGSNVIHIQPQDTSSLDFGKYVYDVQLTTESGDVYTIIEPTTFEIMSEVTC